MAKIYSRGESLPEMLCRLLQKHTPQHGGRYSFLDVARKMAEDIKSEQGGNLEANALALMDDPQFLAESHKLELEERISILRMKLNRVSRAFRNFLNSQKNSMEKTLTKLNFLLEEEEVMEVSLDEFPKGK